MSAERPTDHLDYDQACIYHADAQGLTPIGDLLTAAGIPWNLEQTGGFCMIVNVNYDDDIHYLWITAIETGALIGVYNGITGDRVGDMDNTDEGSYIETALDQLVDTVNQLRRNPT